MTEGPAAEELLDAAAVALLVVGSRGHRSFSGLILGSVSQQCVAHAPCPVVVVPGPGETRAMTSIELMLARKPASPP